VEAQNGMFMESHLGKALVELVLVGCGPLSYWTEHAPAGYEDEAGFHFGLLPTFDRGGIRMPIEGIADAGTRAPTG
jgi:hypothetical protein